MSRPYPYRNVNWRTDTPVWEWSERYREWLALAEIHRRENACQKPTIKESLCASR